MSFSFNAAGTPKEIIAKVGHQAANVEQMPTTFGNALIDELARLPEDAEATLVCYGHTGWDEGQRTGQISLHATLDVRVEQPRPAARIEDRDPVVQPGPSRFPEGFESDAPPGPGAGDAVRA